MTTQTEIVSMIGSIILEQLDLIDAPSDIGPETPLFDDGLELDSFGIVELISALETELSIEFGEDDFLEEHFRSVGTLSDLILGYLQSKEDGSVAP